MFRTHKRNARGFTLTELAVVLGITAILIGAIWVAGASVYQKLRVSKGVDQIMRISQNVRNYYSSGTMDPGDLTQRMMNANLVPADMIATCVGAPTGLSPCPTHPWGGELTIGSQSGWGGAVPSTRRFEIVLWGLKKDQCTPIMQAILEAAASNNVVWIYSDGAGGANVTAVTAITSNVIANCNNNVVFQFNL